VWRAWHQGHAPIARDERDIRDTLSCEVSIISNQQRIDISAHQARDNDIAAKTTNTYPVWHPSPGGTVARASGAQW